MEIDPPQRLVKKYKQLKFINEGTYGSVWHASIENNHFAIKSQTYAEEKEDGIPGTLLRELDILSRLSHPSIVKLHKIWHGNSNIDMVFPYYEKDLGTWIEKTAIAVRKEYMDQVFFRLIDVLCALHENEIYHLDIKPKNILMDSTNLPVICDFGISCTGTLDTFNNAELCSMHCRPPELLANLPIDKNSKSLEKIDIWAMGCVFLHYIVGKNPFNRGQNKYRTLISIINEEENLTAEDLIYLQLDPELYLDLNKKNKMVRSAWKTVKRVAPKWYPLLRSMLSIRSDKRITTGKLWESFSTIFGAKNRLSYEERIPQQVDPPYQILSNILAEMTAIALKSNVPHILPLAAKLYIRFTKSCHYNAAMSIQSAICCTFLALKYLHYMYPSLDSIYDGEDSDSIIDMEKVILSSFLYRIGNK